MVGKKTQDKSESANNTGSCIRQQKITTQTEMYKIQNKTLALRQEIKKSFLHALLLHTPAATIKCRINIKFKNFYNR